MNTADEMEREFEESVNSIIWNSMGPHSPGEEKLLDLVIQLQSEVVRLQRLMEGQQGR